MMYHAYLLGRENALRKARGKGTGSNTLFRPRFGGPGETGQKGKTWRSFPRGLTPVHAFYAMGQETQESPAATGRQNRSQTKETWK